MNFSFFFLFSFHLRLTLIQNDTRQKIYVSGYIQKTDITKIHLICSPVYSHLPDPFVCPYSLCQCTLFNIAEGEKSACVKFVYK